MSKRMKKPEDTTLYVLLLKKFNQILMKHDRASI